MDSFLVRLDWIRSEILLAMNLLLFKSLSVRWTLASSVPPFLFLRATLILPSTSNQPPPPPHPSPQLTSTTRHSYQHPRSHISFVLLFVKCPAVPLLDILLQMLELCLLPQSLASLLCASLSWCLHCCLPSTSHRPGGLSLSSLKLGPQNFSWCSVEHNAWPKQYV